MKIVKKFLKYYIVAYLVILALMLVHYPPSYFYGTTIEYISEFKTISKHIIFYLILGYWALLFIPFLYFSKVKYLGSVVIGFFALFTGFEKYMLHLQDNYVPWNIGFNETMLISFMSVAPGQGWLDAFKAYSSDPYFYIYLIAFPLIIFIVIKYIANKLPEVEIPNAKWIALGIIVMLPTFFEPKSVVPYVYRVMYTVDSYAIDYGRKIILNYKRKEAYFKDVDKKNQPNNIIMIMDESIRGDLVSLNNPELKDEQPYLYSLKDKIINFGSLYAVANCSDPSNTMLLQGVSLEKTEDSYKPKNNFALSPTLLQYMKNAGYKVHFIDGVSRDLFYGLHSYDREFIDVYKTFYKEKKLNRDIAVLNEVNRILKEESGKNFIYIVKQGMHFPFEENFDHKKPYHKNWGKDHKENGEKTHQEFFNTYMNGVKVTADEYMEKMVDSIGNTDTVVFYQSDHGVNIVPDIGKNHIRLTHCEFTLNHYKELYNVPGFMYSPNKEYYKGYYNLKNGYSSKHMLPTILDMAGYNEKDYKEHYGSSFKTPDAEIPLFMIFENTFRVLGESNVSDIYEKKNIDPLNKKRELPNSLEEKKLII